MVSPLKFLHSVTDLDAAIAESHARTVLLLKFSATCGTSGAALEEVHAFLKACQGRVVGRIVVVQTARTVSDEIAARFGIRHESPQALLLNDGRVVWHASHFHVTADALDTARRSQVARPA